MSDVPYKHIFHMMLVKLFLILNGGPDKHIIIPDTIVWYHDVQHASSYCHFKGKIACSDQEWYFVHAGKSSLLAVDL